MTSTIALVFCHLQRLQYPQARDTDLVFSDHFPKPSRLHERVWHLYGRVWSALVQPIEKHR